MIDDNPELDNPELLNLGLGKPTEYKSTYSADLLQVVPRSLNRADLGIVDSQPFVGVDVWHAYELSWLNPKGKPLVALARCSVTHDSINIIESKSFKLYLNSFNQSCFDSIENVQAIMAQDLSDAALGAVTVELLSPDQIDAFPVTKLPGQCIDYLDVEINEFNLNADSLKTLPELENVSETLHSHLLKSNCLITNQPDWASVIIEYSGKAICPESLLRYLVSFRMHNEFHEQCVERIFCDIFSRCQPDSLSVQALYTRRGGLDINPYRVSLGMSDGTKNAPRRRINRQ